MEEVHIFSLERHDGSYEKWPLRTRLFVNGEPTSTTVPGYTILHQFKTEYGYLLVTDCDCLFEEMTSFVLIDSRSMRILSYKHFSAPYGSFNLDGLEWIDSQTAKVTFYQDDHWLLTLRSKGIPHLFPRMKIQRIRLPPEAADD